MDPEGIEVFKFLLKLLHRPPVTVCDLANRRSIEAAKLRVFDEIHLMEGLAGCQGIYLVRRLRPPLSVLIPLLAHFCALPIFLHAPCGDVRAPRVFHRRRHLTQGAGSGDGRPGDHKRNS